ncbi:hypothetical protein SAY86_018886 [Trapa natans]|uniref:Gnk2-homologous domain-containing protein n=1 Tax=Trapa natans TaxID=22666 RepID=A0AAN7R3K7_TRANT|nr:hypothetical protein SAY86_018886 [Trapa natans]
MSSPARSSSFRFSCLWVLPFLASTVSSSIDTFVFGGCSTLKYSPGSPYQEVLNSLLTSLVNSAEFSTYSNFTAPGPGSGFGSGSSPQNSPLYGLFQCRGDLNVDDCSRCVNQAVSRLGTLCVGSCGGLLQLDGCLVKYDNATFLGVQDKTVVLKKCAPISGYQFNSDEAAKRDSVLGYVETSDGTYKPYRTGWSGGARAVAQCVQDLSSGECQDCLTEAIGQLKSNCGGARWGDMFLGKCYVRYFEGGIRSHAGDGPSSDDNVEKTLAILIGLIAAVALIMVFLSFLGKSYERSKGGGK